MLPVEEEPKFVPVTEIHPDGATWTCPVCGVTDHVDLDQDNDGIWRVPLDERFVQCSNCYSNIDIGFAARLERI